ncbi:serine/threonine protein kinase [Plantactinospora sp. KLBMP9567]|uniref:serine/threonine protein kinase n=1 Tax=Plantactinospora sp. KLBMP9567 TaxID=3085900 RepID=UPI002982285D|nr:protein kinase [Plantactinospora sp. KLBMP9567]MDW5327394.1 protein kinase [Plantactinospora sp. KLBMP9567]
MTGEAAGVRPLRPTDPRQLGPCELVGRLGEGGMGTVYLARLAGGRTVAVKVIRPDLAYDAEFRRRFRGEVRRARQVPPFCTAEVLDADPDHDPPYLVVEYVDGPSLSTVVADRGPLTPGNLYGLAIGMATALTAIHGAGVIHRDLKPSNVLLPPGSPKVIDFGIARAMHGTAAGTRTDQVIGTVAYMAPERFESATKGVLTPAADVFAWGAVVAYAGTGRTPFAAETPAATAVRIMTEEPDLDGLTGPLRELVELALAKEPHRRPAIRDLLDRLLAGGPGRSGQVAGTLVGQPDLLAAVERAQAATDQRPLAETALAAGPAAGTVTGTTASPPGTTAGPSAIPDRSAGNLVGRGSRPVTAGSAQTAAAPPGVPAGAVRPALSDPPVVPDTPALPGPPGRRGGSRWGILASALFALVGLLGAAVTVGYASGMLPPGGDRGAASQPPPGPLANAGPGATIGGPTAPSGSTPTGAGPSAGTPPPGRVVVADPLTGSGRWLPRTDERHRVGCEFDGGLVVSKRSDGPYRCPGPQETWTDVRVDVDVTLVEPSSCAGIWFRFTDAQGGYVLRVCADGYHLMRHGSETASEAGDFPYPPDRRPDGRIRVGVVADGADLRFYQDGRQIGTTQDTAPVAGRVVLGIFSDPAADQGPELSYRVTFGNVEIATLD